MCVAELSPLQTFGCRNISPYTSNILIDIVCNKCRYTCVVSISMRAKLQVLLWMCCCPSKFDPLEVYSHINLYAMILKAAFAIVSLRPWSTLINYHTVRRKSSKFAFFLRHRGFEPTNVPPRIMRSIISERTPQMKEANMPSNNLPRQGFGVPVT